ncbi:MAG: ABC transporter ATP-binding protein, partial [Lachnospiraceae bacterium]|nr:ABC transporter ATP-binding protein [Lachnospiraceae bacterium]
MKQIIEMEGINKYYTVGETKLHVLKNIGLQVSEGEFIAVLGPSGSGKSTLMNMIGCMDKPDSGTYYLDGTAIHTAGEKQLTTIRNEKIGFIFQKYHLIPTYN